MRGPPINLQRGVGGIGVPIFEIMYNKYIIYNNKYLMAFETNFASLRSTSLNDA